jgi:redox-sensitive bicupin YhaK (pirin superfamily)
MTAGSGLQHAEMFPLLKSDSNNTLELFQIWLNLPRRNKLVNPHFTMLWNEMIPKISIKDGQKEIKVELISGKLNGISAPPPPPDSWAFDEENFVSIWIITMEAGSKWNLPKHESGLNRNLYFFRGSSVKVAEMEIPKYNKISLHSDMETLIENTSDTEISFLFLQARPIQEPVVQYGPFVMNTREEIESTFREYQISQFGGWPYETSEPVHGKEKGRFAKHADGREDLPPV